MTTTRRRGDVDLTAPERGFEGDDIEVLPDAPHPAGRGRVRAIVVTAVAVVLAAAGFTLALQGRHDSGSARLSSVSRVRPITSRPPAHKRPITKQPAHPRTATANTGAANVTVPRATPTSAAAFTPASPPPVTPVTSPPTVPPVEPASVLTWQSTPAELTLKAGAHSVLTVTVTNPTAGTVTLGTPLSCAPLLQTDAGVPIGNPVCEQMALVMQPHQTLTQSYTIYATTTADASGAPLAAGRYIARVEGLKSFRVNVT